MNPTVFSLNVETTVGEAIAQLQVSEDWEELVLWAERTLESARDQFGELKITEIAV